MKFTSLFIGLFLLTLTVWAQKPEDTEVWEPEPKVVVPGKKAGPPSDAIVLFDGKNLAEWESVADKSPAAWTVKGGKMIVAKGKGDIRTKRQFTDFQLHIEWKSPKKIVGKGQGRGNSGVFLQERYEIQILDSYQNRTYSNGQAGSLYKQSPPAVNAKTETAKWQTYDIAYRAPRFDSAGKMTEKGRVTVIHNGVLIQNNTEIEGTSEYIGPPKVEAHGPAAIKLQDHGNPVSFRNIWIREL